MLVAQVLLDLARLAANVARVLGLDLQLLHDRTIQRRRAGAGQAHEHLVVDPGPAQQFQQRALARQRLAQHCRGVLRRYRLRAHPCVGQAPTLLSDGVALRAELRPVLVANHTQLSPDLR